MWMAFVIAAMVSLGAFGLLVACSQNPDEQDANRSNNNVQLRRYDQSVHRFM
jgi:hypothetical protein